MTPRHPSSTDTLDRLLSLWVDAAPGGGRFWHRPYVLNRFWHPGVWKACFFRVLEYTSSSPMRECRSGVLVDYSALLNGDGQGIARIRTARGHIPDSARYVPVFRTGLARVSEGLWV